MARTKEFDVEAALDRAVEQFRQHGFKGTSMQDLQSAMGIGRQSIYDTFGDKRQLFLLALERYTERGRSSIGASLMSPDASLPQIREYFEQLVRFLTPRRRDSGCLVAGAIVEIGEDDAEVAHHCRGNERALTRALRSCLQRARERGEVHSHLHCESASLLLMSQVYGITVLARNGATRSQLRRTVNELLEKL